MNMYETIVCCRLCGCSELDEILDLGSQPLANGLAVSMDEEQPVLPLALCRCRACATVQLSATVSPEAMFREYVWVSGTSRETCAYSELFYGSVEKRAACSPLFVVEVASNDGTFLRRFKEHGHRVLGVDPAINIARMAEASGVPTIPDFFGLEVAQKLTENHGYADVVIARNVLPHVPNPNDLIAGIKHCLKPDGTGVIEFHYAGRIVQDLHYDSIYHEHFFYYTLQNIGDLLRRHSLYLFDITDSSISGGSIVAYFSKIEQPPALSLLERLEHEESCKLGSLASWLAFADRAEQHRLQLTAIVEDKIKAGEVLIGYGASARSSTLLNFCGITNRHLCCIADQNPLKHGRYTAGTAIEIVPPEEALARKPDTMVLLAWNFRNEITDYLGKRGFHGDVVVPLPNSPQIIRV